MPYSAFSSPQRWGPQRDVGDLGKPVRWAEVRVGLKEHFALRVLR